jgi:hypothetical protein
VTWATCKAPKPNQITAADTNTKDVDQDKYCRKLLKLGLNMCSRRRIRTQPLFMRKSRLYPMANLNLKSQDLVERQIFLNEPSQGPQRFSSCP